MPYKTVGFFLSAIMVTSSLATFFILPAAITLTQNVFFKRSYSAGCNCINCIIISTVVVTVIAYVLYGFNIVGLKGLTIVSAVIVILFAAICNSLSRRQACLETDLKGDKK